MVAIEGEVWDTVEMAVLLGCGFGRLLECRGPSSRSLGTVQLLAHR